MSLIHVAIGTRLAALYSEDGSIAWRTTLPTGSGYATLALQDGRLLAGIRGEVYCLDPETGTILWHNRMKGCGFGLVSFAGSATGPVAAKLEDDSAAAAIAAAG